MNWSDDFRVLPPLAVPHAPGLLTAAGLPLVAWLANWITRRVLLQQMARLAREVPALIGYAGIDALRGLPDLAAGLAARAADGGAEAGDNPRAVAAGR